MSSMIRGLVSKKKIRFQEDGFDLDLTYITPQVIAMGFPSTGAEARYRNPLTEVQRFFNKRHEGHYKIYNLCSEREYDFKLFEGSCARYPFDDHNPCKFKLVKEFCEDVDQYLKEDDRNVVAIHCKAGKGRTGMMICCYLVHSRVCANATEALELFGKMRTKDGKGVTIPSQIRWVYYYDHTLKLGRDPPEYTYRLRHIRMHGVPNFDVGGGCDPYFDVRLDGVRKIFDYKKAVKKLRKYRKDERYVDLDLSEYNVRFRGDVKLVFFDHDNIGSPDKMFHFWINTRFIDNNYLRLSKQVLDKAVKDKKCKMFRADFMVELFLDRSDGAADEFKDAGEITRDDTDDEDEEKAED